MAEKILTDAEAWGYSAYNEYNRFPNLDGIEGKIIQHFIKSESAEANVFWKLLKYPDERALFNDAVSTKDRQDLVCTTSNGETSSKRVFFTPSDNNAQSEQCSSVHIYVEQIVPVDNTRALVGVSIDTATSTKSGVLYTDADPTLSENPSWVNPNESDEQGNIVVPFKSRETTLVKVILAELNGLYLDGLGYINFNGSGDDAMNSSAKFNTAQTDRSFYGHHISFKMMLSGVSSSSKDYNDPYGR